MEKKKMLIWVGMILVVMALFASYGLKDRKKTAEYDPSVLVPVEGNGITAQLPAGVKTERKKNVDFYAMWQDGVLICGQDKFDDLKEGETLPADLNEYTVSCIKMAGVDTEPRQNEYGETVFDYSVPTGTAPLYYYVVCKEGTDCYWICSFVCEFGHAEQNQENFAYWSSLLEVE